MNNVEFFFLRPKDIAIYVGSGQLDFGITGRDLAAESQAPVRERLALGFGSSSFRYAAPAGRDWSVADLAGTRIATAYPNLVRKDLADKGIDATVIRLDGAVASLCYGFPEFSPILLWIASRGSRDDNFDADAFSPEQFPRGDIWMPPDTVYRISDIARCHHRIMFRRD